MSDLWIIILTALAGFLTGVMSGMFGIGGAVISTPAINWLGATPLAAVASTLPSIIPGATSGSLRYRREGLLNKRVILWTALSGVTASVSGALLSGKVPGDGHLLMLLTAGLVAFGAIQLGRKPASNEGVEELAAEGASDAGPHAGIEISAQLATAKPRTQWWRLMIIGIAAGGLSGLLGVGGGLIMVPLFTRWVRLPLKMALGSSLACAGILAIPGTITYAIIGQIDWLYALPLAIGIIPGARVGSALAIKSSDRTLRLIVSSVLGVIAVAFAIGEIYAIIY